jgi:hypothetical protein
VPKEAPGVPVDKIPVGLVRRQRVSVASKQLGPKLGCLRLSPIAAGAPGDDLIQEIEELVMSVNAHDSFSPLRHVDQVTLGFPVKEPLSEVTAGGGLGAPASRWGVGSGTAGGRVGSAPC